jgi:hypothetical protein
MWLSPERKLDAAAAAVLYPAGETTGVITCGILFSVATLWGVTSTIGLIKNNKEIYRIAKDLYELKRVDMGR